ncbi:hypothetical protein [Fluviicola sp.]|jgi:hypothetical protein|uniref:hypothetical protein n=1 Tax=Fluviicola sp. TaxID=1917219 RepID=UPI0028274273|nr:hypothetical protein [Fluviicola sp.]MDR0801859.1 hypothetical protein [Fluviicola sp.]
MQIKKRIYAAFLVVLLTASSLLIFICINLLSNSYNNPFVPIPRDSKWVIRIDAESFVKTEIYHTLFTEKDDAFIQQVRDLVERSTNENLKKKSLFINFQEDIVLYGLERNHKNFLVTAVQTFDGPAFSRNILDYCKVSQTGGAKDHCGIYIHQIKGEKASESELKAVLNDILSAPLKELHKAAPEKNELIAVSWNNHTRENGFSATDLSIQYQDNEINLEGKLAYTKKLPSGLKFGLAPKGVYIYSRMEMGSLPDTLFQFFPKNLPHFTEIQGYAVDLNGTALEDSRDSLPNFFGYLPVPVMNLIVRTKNNCNVEDLWKAFPASVRRENLRLNFGNISFQLKQLSPDTYFIGVNPDAVISYSGNDVFFIKGRFEKASQIYGSSFLTSIIENMAPVKAFNNFLKSMRFVRIDIKPGKGDQYIVSGKIQFRNKKQPLHELSKMILGLGAFEL